MVYKERMKVIKMRKIIGTIVIVIGAIMMGMGIWLRYKGSISFSMIRASGPKSVFLAGKIGHEWFIVPACIMMVGMIVRGIKK